ncbi:chaperonin 10-like protein [Camillea tinctor]|nr:chaperonin 10-like protein [Camillea tinctor]
MSNTQQSRSIFVRSDGKLSIQEVTESYTPQGSQSLIQVKYSGINPCDLNFFHIGLHSFITGFDFAGTVVEKGPDSPFQVGDTVCGTSPVNVPQASHFGSHQDLVIGESRLLYQIPPGLDMKDASALVLVSHTAIDGLFNALGFGFPAADIQGDDPKDRPILIWGGATSVGIVAIQLAKAAGFSPIFTTASSKNHATLKEYGATKCFDYNSPSVLEDIKAAAKSLNITLSAAFDTAGKGALSEGDAFLNSSPALTKKSLSPGVAPKDLKLACSQPVPSDPAFKLCTSYRPHGSFDALGFPQDPKTPERVYEIMKYFIESKQTALKLPKVTAVKGAEAGIAAIEKVAHGNVSLEKITIEHPM